MKDDLMTEKFMKEVDARLRMMFNAISEGLQYSDVERARLSGFMQAGVFLGLVSKREVGELMAQLHLEELGETIEERRKRKGSEWREIQPDFSAYDTPAYERKTEKKGEVRDRARVPVRVGERQYSNFKEALRATGLLGKTTSSERTRLRRELKSGKAVSVDGVRFLPAI